MFGGLMSGITGGLSSLTGKAGGLLGGLTGGLSSLGGLIPPVEAASRHCCRSLQTFSKADDDPPSVT